MSPHSGAVDHVQVLMQSLASNQQDQRSVAATPHPLVAATESQGLKWAFGTIPYAGRWATGEPAVTFDSPDTGSHASNWPEWAYEIAKEALLTGRRVFLTYEDQPFGNNLVFVSLTTL
jgi:hypothetical protein